uniref:Uncharacterized protein n=1 Tax=Cacopsylla melanoneura TaxID=428564 RepID=A0A8D9BK08_9HEMI
MCIALYQLNANKILSYFVFTYVYNIKKKKKNLNKKKKKKKNPPPPPPKISCMNFQNVYLPTLEAKCVYLCTYVIYRVSHFNVHTQISRKLLKVDKIYSRMIFIALRGKFICDLEKILR